MNTKNREKQMAKAAAAGDSGKATHPGQIKSSDTGRHSQLTSPMINVATGGGPSIISQRTMSDIQAQGSAAMQMSLGPPPDVSDSLNLVIQKAISEQK